MAVLVTVVTRGFRRLIDDIVDTVFSFCSGPGNCSDDLYDVLAALLVNNNICVNHVKKRLWKPMRGWPGLYTRVRNTVLRTLRELGYTPMAIILFGSMASKSRGHDIDVAIFLNEYLSPKKLDDLEVELKAAWDSKASLLHWPPLDPFVFSGYKPLYTKVINGDKG